MATVSPSKASTVASPLVQTVGASLKRSSSKASLTDPKPKRQRTKAGCITCRVRGKKCDEQKVNNGESCETCKRLRLHCLGFQDRRPDWLRTKENIKIWRKRVTEFLMSQGLVKGHAGCGLRPGSVPDASLTLEDMRRDLDAWGAPNPDSPSAPLQDHERDMEPEPLGFNGSMSDHRDYTLPPLQNIARQGGNDGEDAQYLPKRFEKAIGGIADEDTRDYRWVPPPPFAPMKRSYEVDVKSGLPPAGPLSARPISGPPGYGLHPPLASPTSGRFDPRQDMRPPGPVHNASGFFLSGPDTNSGSHDASSFPIPSSSAAEPLPPVHHLPSAHDRDRSDQPNSGSTGGTSVAGSYSGPASSTSRNVSVYSQALPTMSPGYHALYSHPKGVVGYSQQTQAPSYGPPTSDPGPSSGPGPDRRPLHAPQQTRHGSFSQPTGHYNAPQYHPYRNSSHSSGGSFASQGSGHNESPPRAQLSIRTNSVSGPSPIPPTHFPHQSVQSMSSSSPDAYNSAYGSYIPTPSTATSASYPSAGMSIQSLLQASTMSTPASIPPSSGISTMVPTPTTAYQGGDQNPGENNTTVMAMTYFQGYPSTYAEYTGTQEAVFQPLLIQATPTMSRDFYLDRYFNQVIGVQYRLANLQTLPRQMSDLSERSPAVRTSISLLSVLYLEAQQLAQSGVAGTLLGDIDATGRGSILGDSNPYSNPQFPLLDLGVPGYGFINSSSLLPSNSTNFRAQYDLLYARVKKLLAESKVAKGERYDQGDAMACLHVISAFLFSGGRGDWDQFLQIAGQWVWGCVSDYSGDVAGALCDMDSMGRFIFRTTMWMDVFGSISLCRPPRFIKLYRTLFSPGALDILVESSVETNMDRVMGCPNEVILAFAEIADLEARKEHLARQFKDLPMHPAPGLVAFAADPRSRWQQAMASLEDEGRSIERLIPEALGPAALPMDRFVEVHSAPPPNNAFNGTPASQSQNLEFSGIDLNLFGSGGGGGSTNTLEGFWSNMGNTMQPGSSTSGVPANPNPVSSGSELGGYVDPDEDKRGKIAEVFRNAARVYLHSVISGCDPLVPTIRRAVQATIRALEILGASPLDRSLIFPLTIAGCLAATRDEVAFCIGRLSSVGKDAESLGNCFAARLLIELVWKKRAERGFDVNNGVAGGTAVSWRDVMMEMNQNPLLLV